MSATTGPAPCASWAATTSRTPSSPTLLPEILADDLPDALLTSCEDFACVLFDMGRDRDGALLVGAAMAERDGVGVPRMAFQEAALAPSVEAGRERLGGEWEPLLDRGAELGVLAAVATALRPA